MNNITEQDQYLANNRAQTRVEQYLARNLGIWDNLTFTEAATQRASLYESIYKMELDLIMKQADQQLPPPPPPMQAQVREGVSAV